MSNALEEQTYTVLFRFTKAVKVKAIDNLQAEGLAYKRLTVKQRTQTNELAMIGPDGEMQYDFQEFDRDWCESFI